MQRMLLKMNSYDDNDAKRNRAKEGIHVLAW